MLGLTMETKEHDEPTVPRPPDVEIALVYRDLATQLSAAGKDANGQHAVGQDALRERLMSAGHSLAAIEWAVHLFCKDGLLHNSILKENKVRTIRSGVSEVKPRTIDLPAIAATDAFWERWKAGSFSPRLKEIILLVHGIRTFAGWQPMVKRVLEEIPNIKVIPIKYGYFDAFRFWLPFLTRQRAIDDLRREIANARAANPDAQLSVIAHSFGTYAISRILSEHPDIKFHRLILAGAIVPRTFRWNYVSGQLATDVINDYGTRDVWPVLAKCLSWGYGDTGRHGFGRGAYVTDRGHDYAHSDFFNEKFVRDYWKPLFENGKEVASPWAEKTPPPSWLLSILSILPVQWCLLLIIVVMLGWIGIKKVASRQASPAVSTAEARQEENAANKAVGTSMPPPPPPRGFPSPETAGVKPLSDEQRASNEFAASKLVIRNETSRDLIVAFTYRPYKERNPQIAASDYVDRFAPEIASGDTLERWEENFGGPVHVSVFRKNEGWFATNQWVDLGLVFERQIVLTESDGVFNCRVELPQVNP